MTEIRYRVGIRIEVIEVDGPIVHQHVMNCRVEDFPTLQEALKRAGELEVLTAFSRKKD